MCVTRPQPGRGAEQHLDRRIDNDKIGEAVTIEVTRQQSLTEPRGAVRAGRRIDVAPAEPLRPARPVGHDHLVARVGGHPVDEVSGPVPVEVREGHRLARGPRGGLLGATHRAAPEPTTGTTEATKPATTIMPTRADPRLRNRVRTLPLRPRTELPALIVATPSIGSSSTVFPCPEGNKSSTSQRGSQRRAWAALIETATAAGSIDRGACLRRLLGPSSWRALSDRLAPGAGHREHLALDQPGDEAEQHPGAVPLPGDHQDGLVAFEAFAGCPRRVGRLGTSSRRP